MAAAGPLSTEEYEAAEILWLREICGCANPLDSRA